jgi:gliding motility-associated-like protein
MRFAFFLTLMFSIHISLWSQSCLTNSLIINTGYDPVTGTTIAPGANGATAVTDPHWKVTSISPDVAGAIAVTPITGLVEVAPGNSADVIVAETFWATNPTGTPGGWISCLNSNTYYDAGHDTAVYNATLSRSFRMCSDDSVTISITVTDDDYILTSDIDGAFLYSEPVASLPGFSSFHSFTHTTFLTAGTHTINFTVSDYSIDYSSENPTGLDIYGTVASATGSNSLVSESSTACLAYVCGILDSCNTVTLPDTLYACTGNIDTLHGAVSGPDSVLSISWSPATGLSDPSILTPILTVSTPGWYYLTVTSLIPDNLIANGNFSAGNVGFSSSYTYNNTVSPGTPSFGPADYVTTPDASLYEGGWAAIGDHTTGTGNMLLIDADTASAASYWCETVSVSPNTNYIFSVWSATLDDPLPNNQLTINGVAIGTFAPSSTLATWTQYQVVWNSGTSTTASICLSDISLALYGNDFVIDDISFTPECVVTDSIYIAATPPDTTFIHTDTTVCASVPAVTLTAPAGYTTYQWNTGATTAAINVSAAGTYWVSETGPCIAQVDTFHVVFTPVPVVNLGDDTTFCAGSTLTLRSSDTYTSPSYMWSTGSAAPSVNVTASGAYWLAVTVGGCTGSDTVNVTVNAIPPAPIAGPDGPVCSGATLDLTAHDDSTAATISWTGPNGFTSLLDSPAITSVTTAATGIYSLTATLNGCTSAVTTEAVLVNATPDSVYAGSNSPICQGDTLRLTAADSTAAVIYSWTSSTGFTSTAQNPVIYDADTTASGIYIVTATSLSSTCSSTRQVAVTVNAIPTLLTINSNSPVCSGSSLLLGSTFNYETFGTFSWTGPNGYTATGASASRPGVITADSGTYSVTETRYGCTSPSYTISVTIDSTPATPLALSNTPVCVGDTIQLTATDVSPGVTYSWTGPGITDSIAGQNVSITGATLADSGLYTVKVTIGVCADSAGTTVSITRLPTIAPASNSPVCSGDTLFLYGNAETGSVYDWTGPYSFTTLSPDPVRANTTTEYSGVYTITATLNNCTASAYDTVLVKQTPPPPYVSWLTYCQYYPAPPLMANDDSITWYVYDSLNSVTYATAPTPSTALTGATFYFAGQTVNGCPSAIDSIQVTVNPNPTVTVTPADTALCPGASYVLRATDTDAIAYYHWYPAIYLSDTNTANVTVSPETNATYTVVASNQYGCSDTAAAAVTVHPAALIYLGDSVTLYPGQTYTMSPSTNCTTFEWFPPAGLSSSVIPNPVASPAVSTKYILYGQTVDGCIATDSINIHVSANSLIAVPNAFSPGNGPNNEFKLIKNGEATLNHFRIYNRWGQKVFETTDINAGWDGTFNGTPQPFDVYVYEIEAVTSSGQDFRLQGNVTLVR